MLEIFTESEWDPEHAPVTAKLADQIRQILADGNGETYDVDAVLFSAASAVARLELAVSQGKVERVNLQTNINELKADVLNLETRLLEAGVRLRPSE
jgi:hypothetical protein